MKNRGSISAALLLILIGAWFLAIELIPTVKSFAYGSSTWPIPIMGIGLLFALVALLTWQPGLMVPACIIAGIGGLLYYQNQTGNWESWAYAWAFIPGFVGVGILLTGLLKRDRGALLGAGWTIFASLVLLAIFGSTLGGIDLIQRYWPLLIIVVGLIVLGQGLVRRKA